MGLMGSNFLPDHDSRKEHRQKSLTLSWSLQLSCTLGCLYWGRIPCVRGKVYVHIWEVSGAHWQRLIVSYSPFFL